MNPKQSNKALKASVASGLLTVAVGFAGLGGAMWAPPAQAIACANCATWITQLPEYIAKIQHYQKEADGWKAQVQGMTDQIASIRNMFMTLGLQAGPQMDEVPLNYNVAERCGGFSISSFARSQLSISKEGDIYQQQKQVCANIQMMNNVKFNETVKFLRDSNENMQRDFTNLQRQFGSSNNLGNNTKASQDADAALYAQEARFKNWESRMTAYDAYIGTMQENQKLLAQTALKGSKSSPEKQFLGQIGKTMILREALRD